MEYKEFKEEIMTRLVDFYGDDANVTISPTLKNNDIKLDGIHICYEGEKVSPVIYLNPFYHRYIDDVQTIDEIVEEIIDTRKNASQSGFDYDEITSLDHWEAVKDKIFPILLSTSMNEELLKKLVSRKFLDLSIVYVIRLTSNNSDTGSVKITHELLKGYGVSEHALYAQAMTNMDLEGYAIQDIVSVLKSMGLNSENLDMDRDTMDPQMFVLSNRNKLYGAAGMLNNRLLQSIGRDLYILPSSVHETILIPADPGTSVEQLNQMISEVNYTQLDPEERLSDHAYFYDFKTNKVSIKAAA